MAYAPALDLTTLFEVICGDINQQSMRPHAQGAEGAPPAAKQDEPASLRLRVWVIRQLREGQFGGCIEWHYMKYPG